MAKARKTVSEPVPASPEKVAGLPRQKNVFAIRGTEDWKAWLDGFATRKGMPVTVLVDYALRELAKRDGYQDAPIRVP